MFAPMLPIIDRERTIIPRTTPNDLTTRYPGRSKVVEVNGCVWLITRTIEQNFHWNKKHFFPRGNRPGYD
jgi:hypothetical protein